MASTSGRKRAPALSTFFGSPSSTVCAGAVRSTPRTTAAGSGCPALRRVTAGPTISVVVRLSLSPPTRNSETVPSTLTSSPTATAGVERVNTSSPSLVAGSSSGVVLWIQKPVLPTAVTTPTTPSTGLPASGDTCDRPWICSIVSGSTGAGGVGVHCCGPAAALRGDGAPTEKSAPLWSVSVHGLVRATDVVLDGAGAGEPSAACGEP